MQDNFMKIVEKEKHCQMAPWHKPIFYEKNSLGQLVVVSSPKSNTDIKANSEEVEEMRQLIRANKISQAKQKEAERARSEAARARRNKAIMKRVQEVEAICKNMIEELGLDDPNRKPQYCYEACQTEYQQLKSEVMGYLKHILELKNEAESDMPR